MRTFLLLTPPHPLLLLSTHHPDLHIHTTLCHSHLTSHWTSPPVWCHRGRRSRCVSGCVDSTWSSTSQNSLPETLMDRSCCRWTEVNLRVWACSVHLIAAPSSVALKISTQRPRRRGKLWTNWKNRRRSSAGKTRSSAGTEVHQQKMPEDMTEDAALPQEGSGPGTTRNDQGRPGPGMTKDDQGQGRPGTTRTRHNQERPGMTRTRDDQGRPGTTRDDQEQGRPGKTRDNHGRPGPETTRSRNNKG